MPFLPKEESRIFDSKLQFQPPFQPVIRSVVRDGSWRQPCPRFEFQDAVKGKLSLASLVEYFSGLPIF